MADQVEVNADRREAGLPVPVPHPPASRFSARARQIAAEGLLTVEQAQAGLDKGWLS